MEFEPDEFVYPPSKQEERRARRRKGEALSRV
jgi:hypothetical protein